MKILTMCKKCQTKYALTVDEDRYLRWKSGEGLIQNMLPELSRDEAELLKNRICGPCYDKMFPEE